MSTKFEKIEAQRVVFRECYSRHLVGPTELESLLERNEKCLYQGLTLATLCDMVLGEDATERSDEDLIRAVRELINKTNKEN